MELNSASPPIGEVAESHDETLPRIRKDLIFESAGEDQHGNQIWNMIDHSRNTFFRISFKAFNILKYWDECVDADEIVAVLNNKTIIEYDKEEIMEMILFLRSNNLVQSFTAEDNNMIYEQNKQTRRSIFSHMVHNYLFFKIPLVHPDEFLNKTYPYVKHFASRYFIWFLIISAILGIYLVSRQFDEFKNSLVQFFSMEGMSYYFIALIVAKISHELGHAYATKSAGRRVSSMGVAFLVMFPILYTDTTSVWRVRSKSKRLQIAAAGMAVEVSLAILSLLLWSFLEDGPVRSAVFLLATVTWIMTLAINLNPLMRFDGYYLLQDWLGVDNLQTRGFAHARWNLREKLFGFGLEPPEFVTEKQHRWFLVYSYSTWIYRFFLFLGIALLVYLFFFKILGIFLFAVEIVWFILRPIFGELKQWWEMRTMFSFNLKTFITLLFIVGLISLLVVPWHKTISLPSIYYADKHEKVYSVDSGVIKSLNIKEGSLVNEGDILVEVENRDNQLELKKTILDLLAKKVMLSGQIANEKKSSSSQIIKQEMMILKKKLYSVKMANRKNIIKANFSGIVSELANGLTTGSYVLANQPLMKITAPKSGKITAYILEKDFNYIKIGDIAKFYPTALSYKTFEAKVVNINHSNTTNLMELGLASSNGGLIAVRPLSEKGEQILVPEETIYEVKLEPIGDNVKNILRTQQGNILIKGQNISFLSQAWLQIKAVLIKESGF